ncbi:T9SS type A sorting domain-containing protein [Mesonia sp.]|uniref:T9SS type A sorting domain-containing protein n=1 Tax=Mesonia sp. TaxID=1960830 RepID=UPI003F952636
MKNKITLLSICLFFLVQLVQAQFNANDVEFWIGNGDKECYLVVDFRDGTTDPSFVWGIKFNDGDELDFGQMIEAVAAAEPNFTGDITAGFLNDIFYNNHSGLGGSPDYWSTWSGSESNTMGMNGGVSEAAVDQRWYGLSYGFSPAEMPTITYPAYSSLWFTQDEFDYAIGEGSNYSVIVVDFVEDATEENVSFAWKVAYDGTITAHEALLLIDQEDTEFDIVIENDEITSINYATLLGNDWESYTGTNMSNWVTSSSNPVLENENWYGIAKGQGYTRRPFTPIPAEENPLNVNGFEKNSAFVYPNPATNFINIESENEVNKVEIYSTLGRLVKEFVNVGERRQLDISSLAKGMYMLRINSEEKNSSFKIIKE